MKKLIAELPTLTAPREREALIIYLAVAKEAISAVLMTDREGRQIPIYFVSRTLRGPEVNYTPIKKLVLALLSASKRLKRYFQAHTVIVITSQPIKQLLSSSEISGRMLKWKFELEGYDIQYRPRTAIKGQILADFIVERPEEESPDELMTEPEVLPEPWMLFTDGSSCVDGSGAGLILINPEGAEFTYAMRFRFDATNNEAEYEALIAGLRIAEKMGIKNLQANVDSRLVANQVNGSYIAKESGMVQYLNKVKTLAKSFKEFSIKQIPRSENKKADALSKIASTSFAHLNKQVLVEELKEKSINEEEILDIVEEEGNTWMTPIQEYLTKEILPEDKKKARAVRRKAAKYAMINGTLYKKSFLGPWLRCVGPLQANYVLREIHEGSCSMHSGPRSVVAKVIQTGYYWPTMHMDARNLIRECNDCQIHRPVPRNPQQNLTPITSPWPFYKWGIDIAGPFPEGPGKVKFLIVAIDYFTKWIEAKAVATITGSQVKKFVWDNIVCRFGLPGEIISDNGKQFRDNPFKDWCEKLCIRQCFASVKHPQANGLVERANRSLGEGIKARLDERSRDWIEELPHVLWAHRTMIKSSNGETPFSLTYGTEAVIPAEIGMPTLRTAEIDQAKNNEALMTSNTDQGPQSKAKYWLILLWNDRKKTLRTNSWQNQRFEATNNEAEYEALIAGLRIAEQMGVKNLQANVDSRLVANQVNGFYTAKESGMVQYLNKVKTLAKSFKEFSIKQIPRSENKKADALSKIASTSFAHLNKQVLVEELKEKSINEKEILDVVEEEGNTWMTPICEYLTKEILPEDTKKARAVRRKAVSMHSGPRSVVAKVIQTGYYWPTMHMDARNLIRECNDCQIHRPVPRNPQQNLTPITSPWL
ncbi:reverse transcriptase domain-containing protein [Tanacetum coccineum]